MTVNRTITRNPTELSIHPMAKSLPEWPREDERFNLLLDNIRDRGIDYPILIDLENRIVDGRKRWKAAKVLQMAEVECKQIAEQDIAGSILSALVQKAHFTKSALAYLAYPLLQAGFEEARRRKMEKLRKGQQISVVQSVDYGKTIEDFGARYGVSRSLFFEAAKVHEIFAKDKEYKDLMEPRILCQSIGGEHEDKRPVGLGAVVAGYGGRGNKDKARQDRQQLELFESAFDTLTKRFAYWTRFDAADKAQLRPVIVQTVRAMPADLRDELAKALKEMPKS